MKISISYYPEEEAQAKTVVETLKELQPTARVKHGEAKPEIHHTFVTTPRPGTCLGKPD